MTIYDEAIAKVDIITEVANRAANEIQGIDRDTLAMTLIDVEGNDIKLDFPKLMEIDSATFRHDIVGILNHFDYETGKLTDCFLPRCKKREPAPEFSKGNLVYYYDKEGNTIPSEVLDSEIRHDKRLWLRVKNLNTKPVWVLASNCEFQTKEGE
jgi:Family of unknown function (DUF6874)